MFIPQLNITRFIAAISIVIFHFGLKVSPFDEGFLHDLMEESGLAVGFFFTLSGFILAVVYLPRHQKAAFSKKQYFVARLARIYPLYLFAFLLTLFLGMLLRDQFPTGLAIILQGLGLHAWVPGMTLAINFPAWSISVELFFYLMFPLLLPLMARMPNLRLWIFAIACWAIFAVWHVFAHAPLIDVSPELWGDFILRNPLLHLNGFVVGMAGGIWFLRAFPEGKYHGSWTLPFAGAILGIGGVVVMLATDNPIVPYATNGIPSFLYLLIIISISLDRSAISRFFSLRPFIFLGDISYGVYLLQAPVYMFAAYYFPKWGILEESGLFFYLMIGLLLLFSAAVYLLLENPARNWIRRKANR